MAAPGLLPVADDVLLYAELACDCHDCCTGESKNKNMRRRQCASERAKAEATEVGGGGRESARAHESKRAARMVAAGMKVG